MSANAVKSNEIDLLRLGPVADSDKVRSIRSPDGASLKLNVPISTMS
jgi:hypothetical protein